MDITDQKETEEALRSTQEELTRQLEDVTRLLQLSARLSANLELKPVLEEVLVAVTSLQSADMGVLRLHDPETDELYVVASMGLPDEYVQAIERVPANVGVWGASFAERRPIIVEDVETDPVFEGFRKVALEVGGYRSVYASPLITRRDEIIGTISTHFRGRRRPSDRETRLIALYAYEAADVIDNARLFRDAQEARERLGFLAEASRVLSRSLDYRATLEEVARLAVPRMADWCVVHVVDDHGVPQQLAMAHVDPSKIKWAQEIQERYPPDMNASTGVSNVIHTGKSELYSELPDELLVQGAVDEEHLELLRSVGMRSAMIVPLFVRGRTLGTISLIAAESGRTYGSADLALAEELARRAAQAVDNSRLYREAQLSQEQLAFLAEASRILAGSLDYRSTLQKVAKLAVPRLADWCVVDMLGDDQSIELLTAAHAEPRKVELIRELRRRFPLDWNRPHPVTRVLRTGRSEAEPDIDQAQLLVIAGHVEAVDILSDLGASSHMVVPLKAQGRTVGTISLFAGPSGRSYGPADLSLVEDLARRAGQAVENARLYGWQRHVARTLQQSLLPTKLPAIPGVEIAARYQAAGEEIEVGGDFYDLFEAGERWGIVIGDVCGKGPEAAAITGMARFTIRAAAGRSNSPSVALRALNDELLTERDDLRFVTVACGLIGHTESGASLTISTGGHPQPLVLRSDGSVRQIGEPGSLLGVFDDPEVADETVGLVPGDVVVFFTDGVVQDRGMEPASGERALVSLLSTCSGLRAEAIAERILDEVIDRQPRGLRDDVAILVLRVTP
jgi:GAF domain-containing protein